MPTDKTPDDAAPEADAAQLDDGQLDAVAGGLTGAPPEPIRVVTVTTDPPDPVRTTSTRGY